VGDAPKPDETGWETDDLAVAPAAHPAVKRTTAETAAAILVADFILNPSLRIR
jgi:hypothetical protein